MSGELLRDIEIYAVPNSLFFDPRMAAALQGYADEIAQLYRATVARRTGRLAQSAQAYVAVGGRKNDRLIGKVVVGTGLEYAALHEFGSKSNPDRQAARDLAEAAALWKAARSTAP